MEAMPTMLGPPVPLVTAPVPPPAPKAAVATHAGARLFFGEGVVAVPPDDAVDVHCLMRMTMPERAVKPPPLPCTRQAISASVRELPGLRNA